ncbi:MAG: Fe-S cluster assembly protein HesB [Acidobacteria bacterium]|nr:MAG: Fe-S cluster assembly protein HesB [Acidobacteriota bacterium]
MTQKISIWTIGHSTLSFDDFVERLKSFEIEVLVDVRSFPGSRRYPHFNKENLAQSLAAAGIEYLHFRELGGRRRPRSDSQNIAWRNESFRGYADYMETDDFPKGIARLLDVGRERTTAIMCSEAVWWRCHRSMISDYLKANGVEVIHILALGKSQAHPFTSAAAIVNGRLSYHGVLESAQ